MPPRSTTTVLLALLASLAGIAWWSSQGPMIPLPDQPTRPASATAATATTLQTVTALEAAQLAEPHGEANEEGTQGPDSDRRIDDGEALPAPEGPLVIVYRGSPPAPAPDIEVCWIHPQQGRELRESLRVDVASALTDSDLPGRFGSKARTNGQGELRLPPLLSRMLVSASLESEGLFAYRQVRRNSETVRLVLKPDETLRLRVTRDGEPLPYMPVAVGQSMASEAPAPGDIIWRGSTDAQGIATLAHWQLVRRRLPGSRGLQKMLPPPPTPPPTSNAGPPDNRRGASEQVSHQAIPVEVTERFVALLALPLPDDVVVAFDGRPAPTDPIELVAPETVPCQVRIVHESGPPLLTSGTLLLDPARDADQTSSMAPPGSQRSWYEKPLGEAPIVIESIGAFTAVGARFRLEGMRPLIPLSGFSISPGTEQTTVDLTFGDTVCAVAFCVLDQDRQPLCETALVAEIRTPTRQVVRQNIRTLADGRMDLLFQPRSDEEHTFTVRYEDQSGACLGDERSLGNARRGQRIDLGELQIQELPLLAHGRVSDDRGVPLAGARISLQRPVESRGKNVWQEMTLLQVRSDAAGHFRSYGKAPPGFRVHATARHHFSSASDPLTFGSRTELRLQRQASLQGEVLLADEMPQKCISVRLSALDAGSPQSSPRQERASNGSFRLSAVWPGNYRLEALLENVPHPIAAVAPIRIEAGTNHDPRLSPLDLSNAIHRYELRAMSDRGPMLGLGEDHVLWRIADGSGKGKPSFAAFPWRQGRATILSPARAIEIVALAEGHAPTRMQVYPGTQDVYLRRLHPVWIDLPGVRGTVGQDRAVRVSMIRTESTELPSSLRVTDQTNGAVSHMPRWQLGKSGGGWLDGADRAAARLMHNGRYQVVLRLYAGPEREGQQSSMELGEVDVLLDGSGAQQHQLGVDLLEVERRCRELDARAESERSQSRR
jgi:hypothetical protein